VFHYLLSLWAKAPDMDLLETVRSGLQQIVAWCHEIDPQAPPALNIVLTDGDCLVGSRMRRSLWFLAREAEFKCDICGKPHVHHERQAIYRSIEIASEPLTSEAGWKGVPDDTVFAVDPDFRLRFEPMH
jgi:glutamine amidotransferase